ncbi:uncharacterized protein L201_003385 [Kwoniella dendrophila CBS 6074]|uniref:Uncharacterized protein n=1 Tax=Kwoniella dendrophila CBS 6074 TaxID=1295534 RepID=A0AAX4JU70_9TREE
MGCCSSRSIDPEMISSPIPIISSSPSYNNQPNNHYPYPASSSSIMPQYTFQNPSPSQLGSYSFPTQSFAPKDLPPGHPFANPYSHYMPLVPITVFLSSHI